MVHTTDIRFQYKALDNTLIPIQKLHMIPCILLCVHCLMKSRIELPTLPPLQLMLALVDYSEESCAVFPWQSLVSCIYRNNRFLHSVEIAHQPLVRGAESPDQAVGKPRDSSGRSERDCCGRALICAIYTHSSSLPSWSPHPRIYSVVVVGSGHVPDDDEDDTNDEEAVYHCLTPVKSGEGGQLSPSQNSRKLRICVVAAILLITTCGQPQQQRRRQTNSAYECNGLPKPFALLRFTTYPASSNFAAWKSSCGLNTALTIW